MTPVAHGVFGCVFVAFAVTAARAQTVQYLTFTPEVLQSATSPLLVEVQMSARPSSLSIDFQPAGSASRAIALVDDGSGGDRVAGDNIYTCQLPAAPILAARTADDVYRVFIGYLNLVTGGAPGPRYNLFATVYHEELGTYPITRLSQFMQATPVLVNIHDPTYFLTTNLPRVTQEFYRAFRDDYDVINIVYLPQRFQNRTHFAVSNAVRGIGLSLSNNTALYGSERRLQGISQFPIASFYDGAETGYVHEFGHQWINFLRLAPFESGIPHWPYSSMGTGIMGISIGGPGGQGGSFGCDVEERDGQVRLNAPPDARGFSDLDLYLMGLMPAEEVRAQIVFADQTAATQLRCTGQMFTGAVTRVGVDDVINAFGPRDPAFGSAPSTFRVATILVTRDGLASPETMWLYSWLTERAEWRVKVPTHEGLLKAFGLPLYRATRGRATMETTLNLGRSDFAVVPLTPEQTVDPGGSAIFTLAVEPRHGNFDQSVTLSCATPVANVRCAFEPQAASPGSERREVTLAITMSEADGTPGTPAGTYVVMITGVSGEVRHSTAVSLTVR